MAQEANRIPVQEVSEGAVEDAGAICAAMDRRDEIAAHRAAQGAELLRRRNWLHLLPAVLERIAATVARGHQIQSPGVYMWTVVLDVKRTCLGREGRDLAARVLAHAPPSGTGRETGRDIKRGYEWLFAD